MRDVNDATRRPNGVAAGDANDLRVGNDFSWLWRRRVIGNKRRENFMERNRDRKGDRQPAQRRGAKNNAEPIALDRLGASDVVVAIEDYGRTFVDTTAGTVRPSDSSRIYGRTNRDTRLGDARFPVVRGVFRGPCGCNLRPTEPTPRRQR